MSLFDRFFKPSPDQYAHTFLAALREHGDARAWHYSPAGFQLTLGQDESDAAVINLGTMYEEHCATPRKARAAQLRGVVLGMLTSIPEQFALAQPNLMPVVKPAFERSQAMLMIDDSNYDGMLYKPLCGDLEIALVYDTPNSMARLSAGDLKKWGKSFDEVLDIAIGNLRDKSGQPMSAIQPGLYFSDWGDFFDASRMLLSDLLYRHPVAGAPVVMVPNRTCLLLTGDRDEAGLARMEQLAEEVLEQPRPLSSQMMRLQDGRWQVFNPPALAEPLAKLHFAEQASNYSGQKEAMDAAQARRGGDLFVATFMVMQDNKTGQLRSIASWGDGVPTLLPKTDLVAFVQAATDQSMLVSWEDAQRVCGELMQPTQHVPVRFEVRAFPTAAQLMELAASRNGAV